MVFLATLLVEVELCLSPPPLLAPPPHMSVALASTCLEKVWPPVEGWGFGRALLPPALVCELRCACLGKAKRSLLCVHWLYFIM